jgi:hypothetical protein
MTTKPIVIVTGWRHHGHPVIVWAQLDRCFHQLGPFALFHGCCTYKRTGELIGVDRYADDWGRAQRGVDVTPFPADWDGLGDEAGSVRNQQMVDIALGLAPPERIFGLAFPGPRSRGTYNCIKCMKQANIEVDTWGPRRTREWLEALSTG